MFALLNIGKIDDDLITQTVGLSSLNSSLILIVFKLDSKAVHPNRLIAVNGITKGQRFNGTKSCPSAECNGSDIFQDASALIGNKLFRLTVVYDRPIILKILIGGHAANRRDILQFVVLGTFLSCFLLSCFLRSCFLRGCNLLRGHFLSCFICGCRFLCIGCSLCIGRFFRRCLFALCGFSHSGVFFVICRCCGRGFFRILVIITSNQCYEQCKNKYCDNYKFFHVFSPSQKLNLAVFPAVDGYCSTF